MNERIACTVAVEEPACLMFDFPLAASWSPAWPATSATLAEDDATAVPGITANALTSQDSPL
ncbi:hypothetical protein [Sphingobium nicotianae]|uniref:Uncharacterized protein n=1 Tax=Sphingobium nicotianae TaxID=2782607 RepID=A0A9X1IT93_9SPHN|nr:hypothetical protein [Sphingobium nicotianae]MBT2189090.1 hypothetical protein [Sphingobium nicotianae]